MLLPKAPLSSLKPTRTLGHPQVKKIGYCRDCSLRFCDPSLKTETQYYETMATVAVAFYLSLSHPPHGRLLETGFDL